MNMKFTSATVYLNKETGLAPSQFCVCSIYINVGEIKYE